MRLLENIREPIHPVRESCHPPTLVLFFDPFLFESFAFSALGLLDRPVFIGIYLGESSVPVRAHAVVVTCEHDKFEVAIALALEWPGLAVPTNGVVVGMGVALLQASEEHPLVPFVACFVQRPVACLSDEHLHEVGLKDLIRDQTARSFAVKARSGIDSAAMRDDHGLSRPVARLRSLLFEDCCWRLNWFRALMRARAEKACKGELDENASGPAFAEVHRFLGSLPGFGTTSGAREILCGWCLRCSRTPRASVSQCRTAQHDPYSYRTARNHSHSGCRTFNGFAKDSSSDSMRA